MSGFNGGAVSYKFDDAPIELEGLEIEATENGGLKIRSEEDGVVIMIDMPAAAQLFVEKLSQVFHMGKRMRSILKEGEE